MYERNYYEKIIFSGQIYEDGNFQMVQTLLIFIKSGSNWFQQCILGCFIILVFEIFRKTDSLGEMGGKLNFVAAILDFGANGGHLGFSNWLHMIFVISIICRSYVPSFMLASQSERFPLFFPISNSTKYIRFKIKYIRIMIKTKIIYLLLYQISQVSAST